MSSKKKDSKKAGAKKEEMIAGVRRYIAFMAEARETFPDRAYKDGSAFFCKRMWRDEWTVGRPEPEPKNYDPKTGAEVF